MLLTDAKGLGTLLYPHDKSANIALERYPEGIVVSHNMEVSKPYNKANRPGYVKLNNRPIEGSFSLLDVDGNWSDTMLRLWGKPTNSPATYHPFYHSYDQ